MKRQAGWESVRRRLAVAAVIAAMAWAPHAAAQPIEVQPAPDDSTLLEGLTVTAPANPGRIERRVETYVSGVTLRPENWGVARWDGRSWQGRICPLVAGLARPQGEVVLARLTQVALAAGAPVDSRRCQPNLYVVVTSEPEQLLRAWKERSRGLFGYDRPTRVGRFLETDRPVRVWYNASPISADGTVLAGLDRVKTNSRANPTRLDWNGVRSFDSVIVIVDAERAKDLMLFQLADYAAMVGLTELDLDAVVGDAPTILRLFDTTPPAPDAPQELSDWDRAFLEALYHTSSRYKGQRSSIATRVRKSLPAAPVEGPG